MKLEYLHTTNTMIPLKTKTGWKTTYTGREAVKEMQEEKCKERCQIFCLVIMTLTFVVIKISLFVMIGKFVFQEEDNLFGFPVKMFSFTETDWINHKSELNSTEKESYLR